MMTGQRGMLKRGYDALALLALLNMLGLVGVIGALFGIGALTREKAQSIVGILQESEPTPKNAKAVGTTAATSSAESEPGGSKRADAPSAMSETEMEVVYREAERVKTEIDQRLALVNSIMLKVSTEREAFRAEQKAAAERMRLAAEKRNDEGFRREIEILESLSPKMALQHLLGVGDADDAARRLMAMDADRAKKIVESAKRGDDLTKMKEILRRFPEAGPPRIDDLHVETDGATP